MTRSKRLELTWIGKEDRPRLEPRILLEAPEFHRHAVARSPDDHFDNILIQGDNLLALKALESNYQNSIKLIFADPPYNTGSAFEHYDDGTEHSIWLSLIRERFCILHQLLSPEGSLWVTIDDNEAHYLKVMLDEIFGRRNFIANVVWQKAYTANQTAQHMSNTHDHILVYAKDKDLLKIGKIPRSEDQIAKFQNPDNDSRGPWKAENLSAGKFYSAGQFVIVGPHGDHFSPPKNRYWRCNEEQYKKWLNDGRITFGRDGHGRPMLKKFLSEMEDGLKLSTWWPHEEVGSNKEASIHLKALLGDVENIFQTPKPEKLIQRILTVATSPNDLVLDSFAGSGTTGAAAQKMRRRWIMVELGEHATTHIVPRLDEVIRGIDDGGITDSTGWTGGGGFRFYRLAPSLLEKDRWGNWIISKKYNPAMLAEAMCKHMGFTYAPSQDPSEYWNHGTSSERDFIFVTTNALTHEMLEAISYDVGSERHLLVCCKAFSTKKPEAFQNLTLKRIPHAILGTCEWGCDDYSLRIASLPEVGRRAVAHEPEVSQRSARTSTKKQDRVGPGLFDEPAKVEG